MATKRNGNIRAVTDADIPVPAAPPKTVSEAAESGDHLELLISLRRRVAETVQDPNCPARDLAALSRRLQELGKEIASLQLKAKQEAAEDGSNSTPDEEWDAEAI
ncbi:hypothetical protein [Frigoribacterium sp. RIT-PI-h]|uniref:hypothetical protein n=1 Tax=Frigoribacterium sp. RIT-PI-h TaxID=1690245 RepID=UPI0006CDE029|nr:hypothetical protein [Frigoribacterium sp. RIT-PI-h]KPG86507.1 hypothetical protein AEQ27_04120 [Frigoribacterium sp. RIT-PI-h]